MKSRQSRLALKASARLAALVFIALASAPLAAQQQPPNDPADQDAFNKRDMRERESALRIKAKTERRPLERNPGLALAQIKEDYERVQILNNELRRAAAAKDAPDYKRIAGLGAEVRKRATRLRENLGFREPEDEKKKPEHDDRAGAADGQVKDSLSALDGLIVSFVNSPLFQSVDLKVDAALAAKASRDLDHIIRLSGDIRKAAEKLHKARDKSGGP